MPALSEVNKATVPLSDIWHDLLEISLEIYQELWRFEFTVALMKSETSGQMLWYCFDTWTQDAYNLCEKVNVLIAHTCKVHNLGNKLNPNPPKDTDGRREDSGRGWVRELQGRWPEVLG